MEPVDDERSIALWGGSELVVDELLLDVVNWDRFISSSGKSDNVIGWIVNGWPGTELLGTCSISVISRLCTPSNGGSMMRGSTEIELKLYL